MRLKGNNKGLTAMVDAMIFIVVLGLAVTAMFAFTVDDPAPNSASSISENIFTAKLKTCDLIETEESGLVSIPDMAAVYILTGEGTVMEYIQNVLDSVTQRSNSYRLDITYQDQTVSIGTGKGDPVCGSVKEYTVTYGGSIRTDLRIY
ncbi:MAG: hypothetical protein FWC44_04515 [Methanomassiliicoccaceae archaeon]|nr:hypothetical protein [Methanomassiliicoccaceae archaeon]MCL2318293.1 hypothetical protein [Methanomassiliicoccaceae archaeon]